MSLNIYLLGSFNLVYDDDPLSTINSSPRLQSLLAYLLLHRDTPQSRQHLAYQLWPASSESQARTNLRKLFLQLRRALPDADEFLAFDNQTIQWRPDSSFTADVTEISSLLGALRKNPLEEDALIHLSDLYRGQLLPNCYDDWIVPIREQLHQDVVAALDRLVTLLENQRQYEEGIRYSQRLLTLEPVDEKSYQRLIRLYMLNGDRAKAVATYQTCVNVLAQELGVEPLPETEALHQQLLRGNNDSEVESANSAPKLELLPLVGRQPEWQTLLNAWQSAARGQSGLVTISGEAGIGKTRLAEELYIWASQQGIAVARTRSYATQGALSYAPIVELLRSQVIYNHLSTLDDAIFTQVARLLPELLSERPDLLPPQPMTDDWQRQHFFDSLIQAVLINGQPLLLLLDDLQWCDGETLTWLHQLLRSAKQSMLLIVGTIRTGEIDNVHPLHTLLSTLRRDDLLTEITLKPLNAEEVAELARSISGGTMANEQTAQLFADTEGNPLFVVETIRAWLNKSETSTSGAEQAGLPPKIYAIIRSRLAQLSPATQVLANLAAACGRSFGYKVLLAASSVDEEELVDSLDELIQREIIREQSVDIFDFCNDTMRDVLYHGISKTRRRFLHRRLARAMADVHANHLSTVSDQLAYHHEQAGEEEQAYLYFLMAGEQAFVVYALQQAEYFFTRANTLAQTDSQRAETGLRLGRVYFAQDRTETAIETFQAALEKVALNDACHAPLLYHLADAYFARYDVESCELYVQRALEIAEAMDDDETLCQSLSLMGQVQSNHGNSEVELGLISEALTISRRSNNRWREARTLADLGWLKAGRGEFAEACTHTQQALKLLENTDDLAGIAFAWNILGRAYGGCGRYTDAFDAFERSRKLAEEIGHYFFVCQVPNMFGWLHQQLGDYDGARQLNEEGVELARHWKKIPAEISALINLQLDILHLGDPTAALDGLSELQARIADEAFGFHAWRWQLRLDYAQALCHLALGNSGVAQQLATNGMNQARATSSTKYVAFNHEIRGAALALDGRLDEATSEWKLAIALADKIEYQPVRWQGRYQLGQLLSTLGFDAEAKTQYKEAAEIITSIAQSLGGTTVQSRFLAGKTVQQIKGLSHA